MQIAAKFETGKASTLQGEPTLKAHIYESRTRFEFNMVIFRRKCNIASGACINIEPVTSSSLI